MENNGKSAIKSATLCRASLQALFGKGRGGGGQGGTSISRLAAIGKGERQRGVWGTGGRASVSGRRISIMNRQLSVCLSVWLGSVRNKQSNQLAVHPCECVCVCVC